MINRITCITMLIYKVRYYVVRDLVVVSVSPLGLLSDKPGRNPIINGSVWGTQTGGVRKWD